MAKLNKNESSQVLTIMDKPGWEALMKLVALTINDLNSRSAGGSNAFETLKSLHLREGKVAALEEFFNDLEKGVSLSD